MKLATLPTGNVTVTIDNDQDPSISVTPDRLTFTTALYNVLRTVTVTAAEDKDGINGIAELSHRSTGGGYGMVVGTVTITEDDGDKGGLHLAPQALNNADASLTVTEAKTRLYGVSLTTQPSGAVTVTVARALSGDPDLRLKIPGVTTYRTNGRLTFTTTDWSDAQSVTLSARPDQDGVDGSAMFVHSASGATEYGSLDKTVTVAESDDDSPAISLSRSWISVNEGETIEYTVQLATNPTGNVTISVTKGDGSDDDIGIVNSKLTFTTGNWNTAQTVTLSARSDDSDAIDGTAAIKHEVEESSDQGGASGASSAKEYEDVSATMPATELDNDAGLELVFGNFDCR